MSGKEQDGPRLPEGVVPRVLPLLCYDLLEGDDYERWTNLRHFNSLMAPTLHLASVTKEDAVQFLCTLWMLISRGVEAAAQPGGGPSRARKGSDASKKRSQLSALVGDGQLGGAGRPRSAASGSSKKATEPPEGSVPELGVSEAAFRCLSSLFTSTDPKHLRGHFTSFIDGVGTIVNGMRVQKWTNPTDIPPNSHYLRQHQEQEEEGLTGGGSSQHSLLRGKYGSRTSFVYKAPPTPKSEVAFEFRSASNPQYGHTYYLTPQHLTSLQHFLNQDEFRWWAISTLEVLDQSGLAAGKFCDATLLHKYLPRPFTPNAPKAIEPPKKAGEMTMGEIDETFGFGKKDVRKLDLGPQATTPPTQVFRDFLQCPPRHLQKVGKQVSQAGDLKAHLHVKTNIPARSGMLFRFLFEGFNYGVNSAILSQIVGYAHPEWDRMDAFSDHGYPEGWDSEMSLDLSHGAGLSTYYSSDEFVVVKMQGQSLFNVGFSVSAWVSRYAQGPGSSAGMDGRFDLKATISHWEGDL